MRPLMFATFCIALFITSGCQEETPPSVQKANDSKAPSLAIVQGTATTAGKSQGEPQKQTEVLDREPPRPPVFENFQDAPKLSIFPLVGDFRPADGSDQLLNWKTSIEQLVKGTGIAEEQTTGGRSWVFSSINSIDSSGYFSPLAVTPQTAYQVSFKMAAELEEGASAGISILEFNKFLWIPGQYNEEIFNHNFRGSHKGKRLTGTIKGEYAFTFITGHETHMIHMVLFCDGTHNHNSVMFDDIKIEQVKGEK